MDVDEKTGVSEKVDEKKESCKKAKTKVSLGALARLLRLPPDVSVRAVAVTEEDAVNGTVSLQLGGEGLPERCVEEMNKPLPDVVLIYCPVAFAMLRKIE